MRDGGRLSPTRLPPRLERRGITHNLMSAKYQKITGFTLIEVMIALAVISIGLLATLNAANQEIKAAIITQDKMTAYWLMQTKIAQIQLDAQWPALKHNKGTDTILGQTWHWETNTKKTENPKIRTIKISLSPKADAIYHDPVLEQTIYVGQP